MHVPVNEVVDNIPADAQTRGETHEELGGVI